ncbi:MAG: hypothetical protein R2772_04640 [Chitinophagales bacterium]
MKKRILGFLLLHKVVWVLAYRMDERFKLSDQTKEVLQIKLV